MSLISIWTLYINIYLVNDFVNYFNYYYFHYFIVFSRIIVIVFVASIHPLAPKTWHCSYAETYEGRNLKLSQISIQIVHSKSKLENQKNSKIFIGSDVWNLAIKECVVKRNCMTCPIYNFFSLWKYNMMFEGRSKIDCTLQEIFYPGKEEIILWYWFLTYQLILFQVFLLLPPLLVIQNISNLTHIFLLLLLYFFLFLLNCITRFNKADQYLNLINRAL